MVNSKILTIISLLLILSVGITSAQTLIAGKIYNSDFSDTLADASVHVACGSSEPLDTHSFSDGTYAIRFNETECNEGDGVDVTASKSGFNTKTISGIISKCEGGDCGGNYFTIINLGLDISPPAPTSNGGSSGGGSGGGGSSRYYLCGNGICDSGENVNTCPQDCNQTIELIELNFKDNETKEETTTTQEQGETQQTAFSKITGAVVGTLKETKNWIAGIFILGIIGAFGILKFRKRK